MADDKNRVISNKKKLINAISVGLDPFKTIGDNTSTGDVRKTFKYSRGEITDYETSRQKTREASSRQNTKQIDQLFSSINDQLMGNYKTIRQNRTIGKIAPEVIKARSIINNSIISPIDMQPGAATFNLNEDLLGPDITADIKTKIIATLSMFWNDRLDFSDTLLKWVDECGFGAGAVAIMVVDHKNYEALNEFTNAYVEYHKSGHVDTAKLADMRVKTTNEGLFDTYKYVGGERVFGSALSDSAIVTNEAIEGDTAKLTAKKKKVVKTKTSKQLNHVIEHANKTITFSTDVADMAKKNAEKAATSSKFADLAKQMFIDANTDIDHAGKGNQMYRVLESSEVLDTEPVLCDIPACSLFVVPYPGDVTKHRGYIIALDKNSRPFTEDALEGSLKQYNHNVLDLASMQFNSNDDTTWLSDGTFGSKNDTVANRHKLAHDVFIMTVKDSLKKRVGDMGMGDDGVSGNDALLTHLFFQSLSNNQVKLVYVPEQLMTYIRFDHRGDGTGKAQLEDINFALSLKTAFLVSSAMGMMQSAIPKRKVEIELGAGVSNVTKMAEDIQKSINNKYAPPLNTFSPTDIADHASTVNTEFKFMREGVSASPYNVSVEKTNHESITADSALYEIFTNLVNQHLIVPAAALNQTREAEYSRSIASNHILFSLFVGGRQKLLIKHVNKFLHMYTARSPFLLGEFKKILDDSDYSGDVNLTISKLISAITLHLPKAQVSTFKAQVDDIDSEISAMEGWLDKVYNEECYPKDDRDKAWLFTFSKALLRAKYTREIISSKGLSLGFDFPDLTKLITSVDDGNPLTDIAKRIVYQASHLEKAVANAMEAHKPQEPDDAGGDTSGGGGYGDWN